MHVPFAWGKENENDTNYAYLILKCWERTSETLLLLTVMEKSTEI